MEEEGVTGEEKDNSEGGGGNVREESWTDLFKMRSTGGLWGGANGSKEGLEVALSFSGGWSPWLF
jgi:hypothetical protein